MVMSEDTYNKNRERNLASLRSLKTELNDKLREILERYKVWVLNFDHGKGQRCNQDDAIEAVLSVLAEATPEKLWQNIDLYLRTLADNWDNYHDNPKAKVISFSEAVEHFKMLVLPAIEALKAKLAVQLNPDWKPDVQAVIKEHDAAIEAAKREGRREVVEWGDTFCMEHAREYRAKLEEIAGEPIVRRRECWECWEDKFRWEIKDHPTGCAR